MHAEGKENAAIPSEVKNLSITKPPIVKAINPIPNRPAPYPASIASNHE
jgi:hypothetical protein